jgi:hypothetical protein
MDYLPHIGRTVDLFLWFALISLAGLNVFFRFPVTGLFVAIIIGVTAVWVLANYICLGKMILFNEEAA